MLDARAAADAICRQAELLIPFKGSLSDGIIVRQSRDWHAARAKR